jgi:hypothetical protein
MAWKSKTLTAQLVTKPANKRVASQRRAKGTNTRRLNNKYLRVFFCAFVVSCASATLEGITNAMSTKYEDNFGFYCTDDDADELAFFNYVKSQSEPKLCVRCKHKVRLLAHIKICATCSQALEYGEPSNPAWVAPILWPVGK